MQKDTIIYVTDQRQKYLADMLGGEQTDCRNSGGIDYERVGNIVFPTPFSKLKLINSDIEKLKHNIIINNIAVWGGMMPECFPGIDRGCDFMRDETVIEQNAIVTAEATASIAIQKSIHGIYGSKVLVSGFGKCGKAMARVFSAMGAHVMVMARRKQARHEAAELGYETVDFNDHAKACFETLFLINTVPDRVIDESLIMILQKDAIIIDIASKPGGCDFEACKRYQINCTHALGLPGIYCPKTGAKILYDCMKRKGMTEGLWLFRIAP